MLDARRTGVLFVAVVLVQLMLISAQVSTRRGVPVLESATFSAFAEIQRATAALFGGAAGLWTSYVDLRGIRRENERLRAENVALGLRLQEQRALAVRGERLGLLLGLREIAPTPTVAAEVIGGDASAWFRTITIDKGAQDGLRADLAVVSPAGVVGRIVDAPAARASRVQLLIDRNAGAGAFIERSRAGGVVIGDGGRGLRMEYVSNLSDVHPGDVVVTSGLDGIYPKGFVIGEVTSVEKGAGLYKSIQVRPSTDFSSLEEVLVVTAPPNAEDAAPRP